jgi:hypothetical protein
MHFDSPPDLTEQRQTAFDATRSWNGKALQPFSIKRRRLFLDMRSVTTSAPFGNVDAMFADSMRFVFLCAHSDTEIIDLIAQSSRSRSPQAVELQNACDQWMEEHSTELLRDQAEVAELFTTTWLGIRLVQPDSAMGGDTPGK